MEKKEIYKRLLRGNRIVNRLKAYGVVIKYNRHLDRVSNTKWRGSEMIDGVCHYVRRWELSGNTYTLREKLKRWGLKWDAGNRCWWIADKPGLDPVKIGERILRQNAKYGFFGEVA
jgi:hypothetical protein